MAKAAQSTRKQFRVIETESSRAVSRQSALAALERATELIKANRYPSVVIFLDDPRSGEFEIVISLSEDKLVTGAKLIRAGLARMS